MSKRGSGLRAGRLNSKLLWVAANIAIPLSLTLPLTPEAGRGGAREDESPPSPSAKQESAPRPRSEGANQAVDRFSPWRESASTTPAALFPLREGSGSLDENASLLSPREESESLDQRASALIETRPDEARSLLEQSLSIRERAFGPDSLEAAESCHRLAALEVASFELSRARPLVERALRLRHRLLGPRHPDTIRTLALRGLLEARAGRVEKARGDLARSVKLGEDVFGSEDPELAVMLGQLACVRGSAGELKKASALYARALTIAKRALGGDHPEVGRLLDEVCQLPAEVRPRSLGDCATNPLAILEKAFGPEDPRIADAVLHAAGRVSGPEGPDKQLAMTRRALELASRAFGADSPRAAMIRVSLANTIQAAGDLPRARVEMDRAVEALAREPGADSLVYAHALIDRSGIHYELADDLATRRDLSRAVEIISTRLGRDASVLYEPLAQLGGVLTDLDDWEGAHDLYARALSLAEQKHETANGWMAIVLTGLGRCHLHARRWSEAAPLLERALELARTQIGPTSEATAYVLRKITWLEVETRDLQAATLHARQALAIAETNRGPWHLETATARNDLGGALFAKREFGEALDQALRSHDAFHKYLLRIAQDASEREALVVGGLSAESLEFALSVLMEDRELAASPAALRRAWNAAIHMRGAVLDTMARRHRTVLSSDDGEVRRLLDHLEWTRANLTRRLSGPAASGGEGAKTRAERLEEAVQDVSAAERALALKSGESRDEGSRRPEIGLEAVVKSRPPGSAIAAYVRYNRVTPDHPYVKTPCYLAFVLPADRDQPQLVDLGQADRIDALIASWRLQVSGRPTGPMHAVMTDETEYRQSAEALRKTVWDPIRGKLGDPDLIFVVPDGDLGLVNFATLPAREGGYLVEERPVLHLLSAERDLADGAERGPLGRGLLLVGDPDFDSRPGQVERDTAATVAALRPGARLNASVFRGQEPDCDSFRTLLFPPLGRALEEIDQIASLWKARGGGGDDGRVIELSGARAGEGAFKRLAPGKRAVHVATHGICLEGGCSAGERPSDRNSLMLSVLALAGANHRQEARPDEDDGILSSEELASIDLTRAEWVVLSACETGTGRVVTGEGVFGLRRAARVAGAHTLIASLWSVRDDDALEWMQRLYRAHGRGDTTASSVRSASLELLRARRERGLSAHPFYWGAFVASGDWR